MTDYVNASWVDQLASIGVDVEPMSSINALAVQDLLHMIDRSDLGVVSFRGSEVDTFLQSQTCNDHTKLSPQSAQLNGYCSPKGLSLIHI